MSQKIYQTLICGVRCNVTHEPGGYEVRRVTESGKSHTILARNCESEAAAITPRAEAALKGQKARQQQ
jgi:hypothetical protein